MQFGEGEIGWAPLTKNATDLTERVSGTIQLGSKTYKVGKKLSYFPQKMETSVLDVYGILLPDIDAIEDVSAQISNYNAMVADYNALVATYQKIVKTLDSER